MSPSRIPRRGLLVIDMQHGLFNGAHRPYRADDVLANINALVDRAHAAGAPVFAARHVGPAGSPLASDSPLSQLLADLAIDPARDTVFEKTRPSCFFETGLAERLAAAGVEELVIVGMKTDYCVDTTCRAARDLGVAAVLVADAHTTTDSAVLEAQTIVEHHNATLGGAFVSLVASADCTFAAG
ncbi:cysteine hydrolase [Stenotrophomonas sp. SAU14A_NAIMI4_5]|uniref:cysteine hydrolase family protein n=1 Tax=Stenotrophomonas sp. SAU14A_NAIMI4_5 TaxID=2072413 RepID=UPI000D540D88|nr:cysteine hydrolase family protein [Stenotrophomonas sp. SAU14A_NAIMI4_5]AWH49656.1 cysteine hydrolase [Stenotrophomonas sp. SAU14A_NAIMI4_5]